MRALDRRRRKPLDTVATPMMPQQIRDSIERGQHHEAQVIRLFLYVSVVVQLTFGVLFGVWDWLTFLPLIIVAFLTLPLYVVALFWVSRGYTVGAGVMAVAVPIGPLVAYTSAFSVDASVHVLLFIYAIGLFVLVPQNQPQVRLYLALAIFAAFIVCETVFIADRSWAQIEPDVIQTFSAINRVNTAAGIIFLGVLLHRRIEFNRHILEGAARHGELLATTDELTGLPNRRPIIAQLDDFEQHKVTDYAIVLIDIDHFKTINDEFGHHCGDIMLQHVARFLREHFRESDMPARWGGDEFLVLMPSVPRHSLVSVLERLRSSVASMSIACGEHEHRVTVSVGAAHGIVGETADECIAAADHALYRAKHEGRNRVVAVGLGER
ncbi:MAG: GGDEF domain-containing protein [Demequina sp.]